MNINIFSNFLNTNICSTFYNLYKVRAESFKFEEIFSYINKNKNKNNIIFIEKKYLEGELFKKFIQLIKM